MSEQLYNHQKLIVERNPKRCLLSWQTGTGKSLAAIELFKKNSDRVIIVVPKALKEKWIRDMVKEGPFGKKEWYVLTKEEFKRDWDMLPKADLIIDEAHWFSGMKSQLSKNMLAYCKKNKPECIWLLTATPYLSTPWNIYRLAQILGYSWSYPEFFNKFFYNVKLGKSNRMVPMVRPNIEEELANLVKKIGDIVKLDECVDVPDQIFETQIFKTNKKQEKLLKEISLKETNPIVKFVKNHQVINGSLKGDEYNKDIFVEADKHEYILSLARENKKIAVFCRYNLQIDSLYELIQSQLKDKLVYIIRGDVNNRDEIVQAVEKAEDCVVLINSDCSEGYELATIGVIVFASLSFSFKNYIQSQGRFLRINNLKKNVFIHLINEDSEDEAVYESIKNKEDFHVEIYLKKQN